MIIAIKSVVFSLLNRQNKQKKYTHDNHVCIKDCPFQLNPVVYPSSREGTRPHSQQQDTMGKGQNRGPLN